MRTMLRYMDYVIKAIEMICVALMILMTVATFVQVIDRYIFHSSFFWSEESAIMGMIYITFMGATLAVRKGRHTRIDFLINMFPPKGKRYIDALDNIICAAFLAFLGYSSLPIIRNTSSQRTVGMGVSRALYYYAILIGCILMVFYLLILAYCKVVNYNPDAGVSQ